MMFSAYAAFVNRIDQSSQKPRDERLNIAIYGLAAEIGSLLSSIKKAMLADEDGQSLAGVRKVRDLVEEAGDVLWYTVSLSQQHNNDTRFNIFRTDIENLREEISAGNKRAVQIERVLTPEKKEVFLTQAAQFVSKEDSSLDDYQRLAFMTSRTEGPILERVCLAVLSQLAAEVLRTTLPPIEIELNKKLVDRDLNVILGEIVWHLAALAMLSNQSLEQIAEANRRKLEQRYGRETATPLHDRDDPPHEQFPRHFDVAFVSVGEGRLRMYCNGRPLGNDLTDNAATADGYRFHDVMHLAILAKLGWSPVMRKLMNRKRKSKPKVDEVEDGARAQIVEELIVKSIHSMGSSYLEDADLQSPRLLFANRGLISFSFLSQISRLANGLEARHNQLWEWEEAILEGSRLYQLLMDKRQGTIAVDLDQRKISFISDVYVDLPGTIVGIGAAAISDGPTAADVPLSGEASQEALKEAVLIALGLDGRSENLKSQIEVQSRADGGLIVRGRGPVRDAIWKRRAIAFRATWAAVGVSRVCTALALADARDALEN